MFSRSEKHRVSGSLAVTLFLTAVAVANIPKSDVLPSEPAAFLSQQSFDIPGWFAHGVTNDAIDSPDFLRQLREASATGNVMCQGFLGMLLVEGRVVTQNTREGIRLLKASANAGCTPAMDRLGYIYLEGKGVPKNPVEALRWIEPAGAGQTRNTTWATVTSADRVSRQISTGQPFGIDEQQNKGI